MSIEKQRRTTDLLFGGIGGAIAASIIAVLGNIYLDSVRSKEQATAQIEIANAKKEVVQLIMESREEERKQIFESIEVAARAEFRAEDAINQLDLILKKADEQRTRVDRIVKSITDAANIDPKVVANAALPELKEELSAFLPKGSVVSFALTQCPIGWKEYAPAYGRFIRGIDKSGASIDPDGERSIGSTQGDQVKRHLHQYKSNAMGRSERDGGIISLNDSQKPRNYRTTEAGGSESRPKNVALLFCVKT